MLTSMATLFVGLTGAMVAFALVLGVLNNRTPRDEPK